MVNALIASLVAMAIVCLLLGWICYHLIMSREATRETHARRLEELINQNKEKDRYLTDVLRVLNSKVGGISMRINDSLEIAETIYLHVPDLFKRCKGLAYWLHANDQFLVNLYATAADGVDKDHRRRIHELRESNRSAVFDRIYEGAGLPAPSSSAPNIV